MHTRILPFHELKLPHLDGNRQGQWSTYSESDGMLYLLNGGRNELADLSEIDIYKDIHFDTEVECYEAASLYYNSHNKNYPYMNEWKNALATMVNNTNVTVKVDDNESQVMRFK